ncbi:MAG: SDR family oxidoreductase [Elusimicrobia bacterium]|nr:SDR family oxidoreductase [Elusimicrobiota bacterium]
MKFLWNDRKAGTDPISQLIHLSRLIGADSTLTQPGGGNTSIKVKEKDRLGREQDILVVKGSGSDLASVDKKDFAHLAIRSLDDLKHYDDCSDESMMDLMSKAAVAPGPAPSVETPLHAFLPYRVIAHTHDFATQALTNTPNAGMWMQEVFGERLVFLPYQRPGFPLAKSLARITRIDKAQGMVLEHHGLVVWADTPRECYTRLHAFINRAERFIKIRSRRAQSLGSARFAPASHQPKALSSLFPFLRGLSKGALLHWDASAEALRFIHSQKAAALARAGYATLEHILRCGRQPLYIPFDFSRAPLEKAKTVLKKAFVSYENEYRRYFNRHQNGQGMLEPRPKILLLPGVGLVAAADTKARARLAATCYRHSMRVIEAACGLDRFSFISEQELFDVDYWSLELAKVKGPKPEFHRKVVFVTGAGSGIGRAVAGAFAKRGAHVIAADLNAALAIETAQEIGRDTKDADRASAVAVDVSRESSVARAFEQAARVFGGVDIIVANAGYCEPAPLAGVKTDIWDRHFAVNARGVLLSAQIGSRLMKEQGAGGTILVNVSKAAMVPAKENAAYTASKAAALMLAKNLALELGPLGIRVNAVNADFVNTPLFMKLAGHRAKKNGASLEQTLASYRSRNLLGVGPLEPEAVAEAFVYLASDKAKYTTGGLLTVDGGLPEAMPR